MRVASQPFAIGAAEKDIEKARDECRPCADESAECCSHERRQTARDVPAAHESDKLEHHDQRTGLGFGQPESVQHLPRLQPVKMLHRILRYILQDGVSAAESYNRCLAEE